MPISIPASDWVASLAGRGRSMPAHDQRALITNALIVGGHRAALVACLSELGATLPPDEKKQLDSFMAVRARVEETLLSSGLVCRLAGSPDKPGAAFAFRGTDDDAERATDALERIIDSYSEHYLPPCAPPVLADPALRLRLRSLPLVRRASAARGSASKPTRFTPSPSPCSATLDEAPLRACEAHVRRRLNPVAWPILDTSAVGAAAAGGAAVFGSVPSVAVATPQPSDRGDEDECARERDAVRAVYEAAVGSLLSEPLCTCCRPEALAMLPPSASISTSVSVVAPDQHKAECLSPAAVCDAIDAQLLASQGMRRMTHIEVMLREIKLREAELKNTRQIVVPFLMQVVPAPHFA